MGNRLRRGSDGPTLESLHKRLLVTGCGRSGTKFTALLLRHLGLDVRHEQMGRDGIAAWTMAVHAAHRPWGPATDNFSFEHVFHQVRHPLGVIPSCVSMFKARSWEYICRHTSAGMNDPIVRRAAIYWLEWNVHAERIATWRYRIEDVDSVLDEMCTRLGLPPDASALAKTAPNTNTRRRGLLFHYYDAAFARLGFSRPASDAILHLPHPLAVQMDWTELESVDGELCSRIQLKAAEYGYP